MNISGQKPSDKDWFQARANSELRRARFEGWQFDEVSRIKLNEAFSSTNRVTSKTRIRKRPAVVHRIEILGQNPIDKDWIQERRIADYGEHTLKNDISMEQSAERLKRQSINQSESHQKIWIGKLPIVENRMNIWGRKPFDKDWFQAGSIIKLRRARFEGWLFDEASRSRVTEAIYQSFRVTTRNLERKTANRTAQYRDFRPKTFW